MPMCSCVTSFKHTGVPINVIGGSNVVPRATLIIPIGVRAFAVIGGDWEGDPLKLASGDIEGKRDLRPSENVKN